MNIIPGGVAPSIFPYNPDQQSAAAKDAAEVLNVDSIDSAAGMAVSHVVPTQAEGANSSYHIKQVLTVDHVPNSMESICGNEKVRAQLDNIAKIIKEMDPREVVY